MKRMNKTKTPQNSRRSNTFQKNKKAASIVEDKKQGKQIQCRECEGFSHIQSECANTLKKKGKALKTTWSDDDSENSDDSDENINSYVVFQATSKKVVDTVKTVVQNLMILQYVRI